MDRISRLVASYQRFIAVPWRPDAAPMQRVVFCVYPAPAERRLRAAVDEFAVATSQAGHPWRLHDLTDDFAAWMRALDYADAYFADPELLESVFPLFLDFIEQRFRAAMAAACADPNAVVALLGVGTLFGFVKVKAVVDRLAPLVHGRFVILFPGSYENNNYRLLDGYDGWDYLATPITADSDL